MIRTRVELAPELALAACRCARTQRLGLAGVAKLAVVEYAARRGITLRGHETAPRFSRRVRTVLDIDLPEHWRKHLASLAAAMPTRSLAGVVRAALEEYVARPARAAA